MNISILLVALTLIFAVLLLLRVRMNKNVSAKREKVNLGNKCLEDSDCKDKDAKCVWIDPFSDKKICCANYSRFSSYDHQDALWCIDKFEDPSSK